MKFNELGRALAAMATVISIAGASGCASWEESLRKAAFRATPANEQDKALLPSYAQMFERPAQPSTKEPAQGKPITDQWQGLPQRLSFLWMPASPELREAPTVLYFHGVFRHVFQNLPKIQAIRDSGFNVLSVDYRGWGLSSALIPSEESVLADARVAFEELKAREPRSTKRVIFGHSLGGAVATAIAAEQAEAFPLQHLVLESTFASLKSITRDSRWYGFVFTPIAGQGFDSFSRLQSLQTKTSVHVWMMHGELDTTVPISQGRELHKVAPSGTAFEVFASARHSDLHTNDPQRYQRIWQAVAQALPK